MRTPLAGPLPSRPLCVSFAVPGPVAFLIFFWLCGWVVLLVFFTFLPACTQDIAALHVYWCGSPLFSYLVLSPWSGFPLGGPRPSQLGAPPLRPPPSVLPAPPLPLSRASCPSPPWGCSLASCAPRCSSPPLGRIFLAHTRRSQIFLPVGQLRRASVGTPLGAFPRRLPPPPSPLLAPRWRGGLAGTAQCRSWALCRSVADVVPMPAAFCLLCPILRVFFRAPRFFACPCPAVPRVPCSQPLGRAPRVSPAPCYSGPALMPLPLSLSLPLTLILVHYPHPLSLPCGK